MKYEGVSFSTKYVMKFNTCEEFVFHKSNQHLWPKLTVELRHKRLGEVFTLIKALNNANSI